MPTQEITNLKRYLAKWELEHLRRHVAELEERLVAAEDAARYEREVGDSWREDAWRLMEQMMEDGDQAGLTKDGEIIVGHGHFIRREATLVSLTEAQTKEIHHLTAGQKRYGGSVIAQVWPDGMRVALITDDEHDQIQEILGTCSSNRKYRSAAEAHHAAVFEQETQGESA